MKSVIKTAPWLPFPLGPALCAFILPFIACLNQRPHSGFTAEPVKATILYLRTKETMTAAIDGDSIFIERKNAADSVVGSTRARLKDSTAFLRDSLYKYLHRARAGKYKKRMVIDGTQIGIEQGQKKIFCDNCLHDWVLEKSGAPAGPKSRRIRPIKETVSYLNQIVSAVEEKPKEKFKRIEVVLNPAGRKKDFKVNFLDTLDSVKITPAPRSSLADSGPDRQR
jgi:hypothetical protein